MLIETLRFIGVSAIALAVGAMLLVWAAACAVPVLGALRCGLLLGRRPHQPSRAGAVPRSLAG